MLQAVAEWFRWLNDAHGINLTIFYDPIDRHKFFSGIWTTVQLSAACVVLSTVIGIFGAWLQQSSLAWTRRFVQGYIQFFRNTPPLIQIYFFYFALDAAIARLIGVQNIMGSFGWAMIALSFFAGAFNVEIFRAGIEAVPRPTDRSGRVARLYAPWYVPACGSAAGVPGVSAGLQQQPRQSRQDHDDRLCHRHARDALHGEPDLVGQRQRA